MPTKSRMRHIRTTLVLLTACTAYDSELLQENASVSPSADPGREASSDSGVEHARVIRGVDASTPDCAATGTVACPWSCGETCNGVDDDCDGQVDEVDARSRCVLPGGNSVCAEGACLIASCHADRVDCNNMIEDGCEASLDSLDHCGLCNRRCQLPNASARCTAGECKILACEAGFGNCDGDDTNGCERSLDTLGDCGACAKSCGGPNASASCEQRGAVPGRAATPGLSHQIMSRFQVLEGGSYRPSQPAGACCRHQEFRSS